MIDENKQMKKINPILFDHVHVLNALAEVPFNVGRKLLIAILIGDVRHPSVFKNKLDELDCFAMLAYDENELSQLINRLLAKKFIEYTSVRNKAYLKVLRLTDKGQKERFEPTFNQKVNVGGRYKFGQTIITDFDKKMFQAFDFFLSSFNNDQKKGICTTSERVLCIAGAGSGKTTVLSKRIEFLTKFRGVEPSKILSITFTRKACQEVKDRLMVNGVEDVKVETFNSFCEKILRRYESDIYDCETKVMDYGDKIRIFRHALDKSGPIGTDGVSRGISISRAIDVYFSKGQRRGKTTDELTNVFMNDCYFILDYLKSKNEDIENYQFEKGYEESSSMIHSICIHIDKEMKKLGLRNYMDQVLDVIKFFKSGKGVSKIPEYKHILIDEFQDVNSLQVELINLLNSKNIFCVGDPRQSIFGWRGSNISHILNFKDIYPGAEVITLVKNYRSVKSVVDLTNNAIEEMGMPDLEHFEGNKGDGEIKLLGLPTEVSEYKFVIDRINNCLKVGDLCLEDVFVLARTNRQLKELSERMKEKGIRHSIKNDHKENQLLNGVTLATVHSAKGLEAKMVFLIGCNGLNFPIKGGEHPVVEMVKLDDYDKEEEERRLFYVALSRAKESLYLTYTGNTPTYFITHKMKKIIGCL